MTPLRILPFAALLALCTAAAVAQPRAEVPQHAASSAEHKDMHKMTAKEREQHRKEMHDKMHASSKDGDDCKGMMDKQHKKMKAAHDKDSADKTAASGDKAGNCMK